MSIRLMLLLKICAMLWATVSNHLLVFSAGLYLEGIGGTLAITLPALEELDLIIQYHAHHSRQLFTTDPTSLAVTRLEHCGNSISHSACTAGQTSNKTYQDQT